MTRRPSTWIFFGLLSMAGLLVAVRLFPTAFPIATLDLEMDRQAAVSQAETLARQYAWDPPEARTAATFGQTDPEVQTYVELEAGGRDAFAELAERGIYHRICGPCDDSKRGRSKRAEFSSRAGEPHGFHLRFPEEDPGGGNLPEEEALAIAERTASQWGVDPPLSSSSNRPRRGIRGGAWTTRSCSSARTRRWKTAASDCGSGSAENRASELAHFVYVPEAFSQRYRDMRSANDGIALASQSVFVVLFLLLGGVGGTALLMRRRWVIWRPPLAWGALTALLLGLGVANTLPLRWMGYDPAVSVQTFLAGQLALAASAALIGTPLLALIFLAGESLGRRAFPSHIQQWRFWSSEVAASTPVLGRTAGAYLLLGLQLGYVVLFYAATSRLEGWWSPAEAVVQPDLLATPQPWLLAVSTSLFAAFWEESAFRAIPIACAALLGQRYGRKNLWIWGAVALQAVVFAAGHANYPQQPAYARLIELTVPALLWGVILPLFRPRSDDPHPLHVQPLADLASTLRFLGARHPDGPRGRRGSRAASPPGGGQGAPEGWSQGRRTRVGVQPRVATARGRRARHAREAEPLRDGRPGVPLRRPRLPLAPEASLLVGYNWRPLVGCRGAAAGC